MRGGALVGSIVLALLFPAYLSHAATTIGADQAKEIALKHLGLTKDSRLTVGNTGIEIEVQKSNGHWWVVVQDVPRTLLGHVMVIVSKDGQILGVREGGDPVPQLPIPHPPGYPSDPVTPHPSLRGPM